MRNRKLAVKVFGPLIATSSLLAASSCGGLFTDATPEQREISFAVDKCVSENQDAVEANTSEYLSDGTSASVDEITLVGCAALIGCDSEPDISANRVLLDINDAGNKLSDLAITLIPDKAEDLIEEFNLGECQTINVQDLSSPEPNTFKATEGQLPDIFNPDANIPYLNPEY